MMTINLRKPTIPWPRPGFGASTTNQMSPGAFQDLYLTGDEGLLDVAMDEMHPDALHQFLSNLPSPGTIAGWPDVGNAPPVQTSSTPGQQRARSCTLGKTFASFIR